MNKLDEAIEFWIAHGWKLETKTENVAIMVYDDRGWWIRITSKKRTRLGRISLSLNEEGTAVGMRLLSKLTTDPLHWARYLHVRRKYEDRHGKT